MQNQRPLGLIVIVMYKAFVALLLAITAIFLLLALKNYQSLAVFSESYLLEGKLHIIEFILEQIIRLKRQTLLFSGLAAGIYGILTAIEALGLWYRKKWAGLLVLALVGVSIPLEVVELIKGLTILKLGVFLGNIAILWYLIRHFPKSKS
ncbi:DUF2127 domain-containing protein [Chroogloeocystis siderophila]|jgi:uncharacterized membrane protein (DUF2068 family)|uniref:DUF2127 domain-containing protein n=1 Tax=Chroogloeocystis siderophila 5.2 s.c.1 TaxID=247279 RepID=A0A1U7HTW6_9CHRO|nr:DUF2127 domain-containing protein [Chroogloeocystis siderophila]OKH27027.1 hypothetical protein NIES1031_09880 [Chroogloeocystis siderophila 5.2 s.c.1]